MRILPIALLTGLCLAAAAPAAQASTPVDVPAGNELFKVSHAVGVQIYTCNGTAWTFTGPKAVLFTRVGLPEMIHYTGPTWQHLDGSTVVGAVEANTPGAPGAIPHLRLKAVKTEPGRFGRRLVKTTYIQRLATRGGVAPAAATCTTETVGKVAEVPYTADYHFWKAS